jgi:hypothetical protein
MDGLAFYEGEMVAMDVHLLLVANHSDTWKFESSPLHFIPHFRLPIAILFSLLFPVSALVGPVSFPIF